MRPEDLVFWLDRLGDTDGEHGVLCQRHADSMVVPRDWTLDDLRDPELHLFRPPDPASVTPPPTRRPRSTVRSEQLTFEPPTGPASVDSPTQHAASSLNAPAEPVATTESFATNEVSATSPEPADDELEVPPPADPWRPDFDATDDLDGLLSADSPLLARAFRGTDRGR